MTDRIDERKQDNGISCGLQKAATDDLITSAQNSPAPTGTSDEADGYDGSANSTTTWSRGKRILRCLLYGIIMALILLVAEGAWRDDFVEGVIGVADSSILGAPLVAFMVALLESGGSWLMTLRASGHPGFERERFIGYLGAGFWITFGFELIMCLATMLGGGVMDVNVRFSTVLCQVATLIIMAALMWQGHSFRALLWPVMLYFLWLTPLLIVLPGSRVITATQRSIVTFELIYGAVLCLLALIIYVRNRKKTQEDIEERAARKAEWKATKADKKTAGKAAKAADTNLEASRAASHVERDGEDRAQETGDPGERKTVFGKEKQSVKPIEQKYLDEKTEETYSGGNVEDKYL